MDDLGSCVRVPVRIDRMKLVRNLTQVKITEEQLDQANFNDGIKFTVRCEKPFTVNAYWIVKIDDLYTDLLTDWKTMRDSIWNNTFLTEKKSMYQNEPQIFYECNQDVECNVTPPKPIDTSSLGNLPRDFYPLILVVTCFEEEPDPHGTDAAANIQVIHIKDAIVPMKSHVIKQISKQIDGKIIDNVTKVFAQENESCMICLEESASALFCLLPCRHSAVCYGCLNMINQCPICRGPIVSVFNINTSPDAAHPPGPQIDPNVRHLYDDRNIPNESRKGFFSSLKSWIGI